MFLWFKPPSLWYVVMATLGKCVCYVSPLPGKPRPLMSKDSVCDHMTLASSPVGSKSCSLTCRECGKLLWVEVASSQLASGVFLPHFLARGPA